MGTELVTNDTLRVYQSAFMLNKSEEGKRECISDIFTVALNSYCNTITGGTIGCFASEELRKAYIETMNILRGRLDEFYLEYLRQVKQNDINFFNTIEEENTLKLFVEYLILCARKEFDIELSKLKGHTI